MSTTDTNQGDVRLTFDPEIGHGDVIVIDRDLERDPGLETAVMVSLGSNRRADDEDALPDERGSRQGWWADGLDEGRSKIGSKLWLLGRGKLLASELTSRAEQYVKEALQWMIDDVVASEVGASAVISKVNDARVLKITVRIVRPEIEKAAFYTYYYNWQAQELRST